MTTKIKTTLLTAFFFFGLLTGLRAQDKYEYGSVRLYNCSTGQTFIALTTGDAYTEKEVNKSELQGKKPLANVTPLIKELNELAKQGWEIETVSNFEVLGNVCAVEAYSIKRKNK